MFLILILFMLISHTKMVSSSSQGLSIPMGVKVTPEGPYALDGHYSIPAIKKQTTRLTRFVCAALGNDQHHLVEVILNPGQIRVALDGRQFDFLSIAYYGKNRVLMACVKMENEDGYPSGIAEVGDTPDGSTFEEMVVGMLNTISNVRSGTADLGPIE